MVIIYMDVKIRYMDVKIRPYIWTLKYVRVNRAFICTIRMDAPWRLRDVRTP